MAGGRPSSYKPEFAKQAEKLCSLGATDEDLAAAFDVSLAVIAEWAWNDRAFFEAITPTDEIREGWKQRRANRYTARNAKRRETRKNNPSVRLIEAMRARLWAALKGRSDGALFSRLGYDKQELVSHLEARFQPGMTWHVDHIRPCASFDMMDAAQFAAAWALDNLNPLWAGDNLRKGSRYVADA